MSWSVKQTNHFGRVYKKLSPNIAKAVDQAVDQIAENPSLGDKKKGDLNKLYVYKFKVRSQLYLLGYTLDGNVKLIYLEAVGVHENFYRDLKR